MNNQAQLRNLALSQQGLASKQKFGSGLSGTLNAIEHLGYVQIDTLSVVERAHHHVLWNRVPSYNPSLLNKLVSQQKVFEYWFHAASYLPMRDYRYALPNMTSIRNGENPYCNNADEYLMKEIQARARGEGPQRARDFEGASRSKRGSWNTRPVRQALDRLYMQGTLMICHRSGMQKTYDLAERCLPQGIDFNVPSLNEYAEYLFDTTLRAHGVFTLKQLLHLKTGKTLKIEMLKLLEERIDAGIVVKLNDDSATSVYADIEALNKAPLVSNTLKVLSPFDNVAIHRERLSSLFEFDYRIECYVSASKREFGYFCLPIIYGNKFVGRIDCKAHRKEKRLEVISLHIEDNSLDRKVFFSALKNELQIYANFNACASLDGNVIDKMC